MPAPAPAPASAPAPAPGAEPAPAGAPAPAAAASAAPAAPTPAPERGPWPPPLLTAATLALGPALWWQGRVTRTRVPRLDPPEGPTAGFAGCGPMRARLLVLGDSSAAGVGLDDHRHTLAWQTAGHLGRLLRGQVAFHTVATSGWTTAQVLEGFQQAFPRRAAQPAGAAAAAQAAPEPMPWRVLVSSGVNDVLGRISPATVNAARAALLQHASDVLHGSVDLLFLPVPPMQHFPALSGPLAWWLGQQSAHHDRALKLWADGLSHSSKPSVPSGSSTVSAVSDGSAHSDNGAAAVPGSNPAALQAPGRDGAARAERPTTLRADVRGRRLPIDWPLTPEVVASDGFHPGRLLVAHVAMHAAQCWAADPLNPPAPSPALRAGAAPQADPVAG